MKPIMLYPIGGMKWANKLSVQDLRAIAHFNRIIKNYLMMERLLKKEE